MSQNLIVTRLISYPIPSTPPQTTSSIQGNETRAVLTLLQMFRLKGACRKLTIQGPTLRLTLVFAIGKIEIEEKV